ncbi:MAG: Asp-tRNA(Asn)/Glu-tRNA(Gln) amidotransferase subunit GatA [Candidatus Saccharimonadales bacterium]
MSESKSEYLDLPIPELVAKVRNQEVTAEFLVNQSLELIKANQDYHAILDVNQSALDQAKAIDKAIADGETLGVLSGVPFIAKDNFLTKNTKTTAASKMLDNFQAPYQASAIDKLEAAGAIMVAKANLDEFAHGSSTENSAYGPTKNPHDSSKVPGGSSGGSAAAVALNITPFALGTDTGGSIRLPASFCGVVGYKPTYGLVSRYGVIAMASSTDVIGPITRSVSDSAYVLDVLAGQDVNDSTTIKRQDSYLINQDGNKKRDLKGIKFGIIKEHLEMIEDKDVLANIKAAIDKLKAAGADIKEVSLSNSEASLPVYYILAPAEISSNLARYDGVKYGFSSKQAKDLLDTYLLSRGSGFGSESIRRILTGTYVLSSGYQDAYYKQAQKVRSLIVKEYEDIFADVDFLIGPTAATTAFDLGAKPDPISMYKSDYMTIAANLAGIPAISIPSGNVGNLPVGLQLQGPQGQDKQLLDVAHVIGELI